MSGCGEDYPGALRDNEVQPTDGPLLTPPYLHAVGGLAYHQGADYSVSDTAVTVVDGYQCVYDGVIYYGGETLRVPEALAEYWARSGWATAEFDDDAVANMAAARGRTRSTPSLKRPWLRQLRSHCPVGGHPPPVAVDGSGSRCIRGIVCVISLSPVAVQRFYALELIRWRMKAKTWSGFGYCPSGRSSSVLREATRMSGEAVG
jgi:hypothetical protein